MKINIEILKYLLAILILSHIIASPSQSQIIFNKSEWSFGLHASWLIPQYQLDFNQLPGVPNCCPNFDHGEGVGINADLFLEYRLFAYNQIRFKAGLTLLSAFISKIEPEWVIVNEKLYPASISHEIISAFPMITSELVYKYGTPVGLYFFAGFSIGYIMNSNFEQKEILVKPENEGTFENGLRTRNYAKGEIEDASSFLFSPLVGAEFDLPLDEFSTYVLTPSFAFYLGLNSILKSEEWNVMYFSIGLSFRYNPFIELSSPLEPKK